MVAVWIGNGVVTPSAVSCATSDGATPSSVKSAAAATGAVVGVRSTAEDGFSWRGSMRVGATGRRRRPLRRALDEGVVGDMGSFRLRWPLMHGRPLESDTVR